MWLGLQIIKYRIEATDGPELKFGTNRPSLQTTKCGFMQWHGSQATPKPHRVFVDACSVQRQLVGRHAGAQGSGWEPLTAVPPL